MNIYTPLNTVSAPCGSGKTYATCHHIQKNEEKFNHLYVAPTQHLIDETRSTLNSMGIHPTVITSATNLGSVQKEIVQYLNTASKLSAFKAVGGNLKESVG